MKEALFLVAVVLFFACILGIIALTIYGLVLGFMAHVLVGVLHLVVTPLSFVTGFTEFFFDYDISRAIANSFR